MSEPVVNLEASATPTTPLSYNGSVDTSSIENVSSIIIFEMEEVYIHL